MVDISEVRVYVKRKILNTKNIANKKKFKIRKNLKSEKI